MNFDQLVKMINEQELGEYRENVSIAPYTSIKVGGIARLIVFPETVDHLIKMIKISKSQEIPFKVLGRGSNIIFPDGILNIMIIIIREKFSDLNMGDNGKISVGAGYSLKRLAKQTAKRGFSGLEFAGGIPATVGGATYMNAGAHTNEFSEVVQSVVYLDEDLNLKVFDKKECQFEYRSSIFHSMPHVIILEINLQLNKADKAATFKKMSGNLEYRKEMQPLNWPTFGSVFRNPVGYHAGKLIEEAGLKDKQIGGAKFSTKHANFIVNEGEAKFEDICKLINLAIETIAREKGINLIPEVEIFSGENNGY